jgi:hypothetical protein
MHVRARAQERERVYWEQYSITASLFHLVAR